MNTNSTTPTATNTTPLPQSPTEGKNTQRMAKNGGKRTKRSTNPDASALRLEAIRALTNLPEEGQFFLIYNTQDDQKSIVNGWGS